MAAHKEGKLQEAERIYRAILRMQPKHPAANHNLGLIAVSVNQIEAAIPLFEAALDINPNVEQHWLSYVDALVKMSRLKAAKLAIKKAKKRGIDGKKLVFAADLLPSAGHIKIPYVMSYDVQPLLTMKEKSKFLMVEIFLKVL